MKFSVKIVAEGGESRFSINVGETSEASMDQVLYDLLKDLHSELMAVFNISADYPYDAIPEPDWGAVTVREY